MAHRSLTPILWLFGLALLAWTPPSYGEAPSEPLFPLEVEWAAPGTPAAIRPAYDRHHAYILRRDGTLGAHALAGGATVWSVDTRAIGSLVAGDGMLFTASPAGIDARTAVDGTVQWQLPLAGISAPLLWDTGWLIAAGESGELYAIRATDGTVLWTQSLSGAVEVRPSIAAERVYVPLANSRIAALDLFTGAPIWETQIGGAPLEILPLDDRLFVGARDRFFYCLSLRDGRRRWRWPVRADIVGAPVVDESHVYLVSLDNVVRALDRGNGAQRWRQPLPMRPGYGPVRVGEVVIVSGLSPDIRGYRTGDGSEAGHYVAPSELAATPHPLMRPFPDGPLLVLLTGEGHLYGVRSRRVPVVTPLKIVPGTPVPLPPPPRAATEPEAN